MISVAWQGRCVMNKLREDKGFVGLEVEHCRGDDEREELRVQTAHARSCLSHWSCSGENEK